MNIAVKVNSSEEFKKVTKYARKNGEYDSFNIYKDESCVNLDDGCHQTESWYRRHEFTIISYSTFEEKYLKLLIPEPKQEEFRVGDWIWALAGGCKYLVKVLELPRIDTKIIIGNEYYIGDNAGSIEKISE